MSGAFPKEPEKRSKKVIQIYVDGSHTVKRLGEYGWGFAVYQGGKEIFADCGLGTHEEAAAMRNVAGELSAAMRAVQWAQKEGLKKVQIHHDYQGLAAWANGEWKAKNWMTQYYRDFIARQRQTMEIKFVKEEAHSGVAGNERADQLAKQPLGL